jgi:hypothetical protein
MRSLHIFNCGVEFFDRMNAWKLHVGHTIDTKVRMVTAFGLFSVPLDSSIGLDERKVDSVGLLEAGVASDAWSREAAEAEGIYIRYTRYAERSILFSVILELIDALMNLDITGERVRTPLRRSAKLSQSIKYSLKGSSGSKFSSTHRYIYG